ncbi:hypothetical protein BDV10DRAFT_184594 [Aspergillus recurvatus]
MSTAYTTAYLSLSSIATTLSLRNLKKKQQGRGKKREALLVITSDVVYPVTSADRYIAESGLSSGAHSCSATLAGSGKGQRTL